MDRIPFIVGDESGRSKGLKLGCDMCGREVNVERDEKGRKLIPGAFFICTRCWEKKDRERVGK